MAQQEPFDAVEVTDTTGKLFTRTRSRRYMDWLRIGVYTLTIGVFAALFTTGVLDRAENIVFDAFQRAGGFTRTDPRIALVEITGETIDEVGSWPWPRRYFAVMARLLDQWGAAAIVPDITFRNETTPRDDQDLIRALQRIRTPLYLPVEYELRRDKKFWIHGLPVVIEKSDGKMEWVHSLAEIEASAKGLGHHYFEPDPDGVLRRFSPELSSGTTVFPQVALLAARVISGGPAVPEKKDVRVTEILPWVAGWENRFTRFSYSDLIHSYYGLQKGMVPVISPEAVKGKICFIGVTAGGNAESRMTAFGVSCPRVALNAQIANAALTGQWIRGVPRPVNLLLILITGVVAAFLFMVLRGPVALIAGFCFGLGWLGAAFAVFRFARVWIFPAHPMLLIFSLFVFSAIYVQATATRERSALFHLATRDGLTELYVIRHFRLIMNQLVREAFMRKEPLSVILLDIDHFKGINDTYGHLAGDMVLKKIAHTLVTSIRKKRPFSQVDFAARYGGEEFILMLRKSGFRETVERVAERLRQKVEGLSFEWDGKPFRVTISLGVSTLRPGENVPDPMVHRADVALYKAKESGRNKVCSE